MRAMRPIAAARNRKFRAIMACHETQGGGNFKTAPSRRLPTRFRASAKHYQGRSMASPIIDFMLARASAPIHELKGPGPSDDEIATMLKIATRVPDHGRLEPWRFILYRGSAREEI